MTRSELVAALGWLICSMAPDNEKSEEMFSILKEKEDMQVIHRAYMEGFNERELRDTFFPEL